MTTQCDTELELLASRLITEKLNADVIRKQDNYAPLENKVRYA